MNRPKDLAGRLQGEVTTFLRYGYSFA